LARQLLSETALLSALAVAASLLCAWWILHLIPAVLPPLPIEVNLDLRIDTRIGLATVAVALAATMLAGLAPALMAARTDLTPIIKGHEGTAVAVGRRRITLRNALVTGQIAVMFLLLESGALLTVSLFNANRTDPGFAPGAMAFATVAPGAAGYDRPRSAELYRQLIARVRQLPGVEAAAFARHVPLNSFSGSGAPVQVVIPGQQPPPGRDAFPIRNNLVSAGYFDTIGARLLRGRDFDERDRAGGERVAVINETMARTYWPGDDPIGRRVTLINIGAGGAAGALAGSDSEACVIVGIVQDTKYLSLRETAPPYMFFARSQRSAGEITLIARGRGDERALAGQLRQTIAALDPELPSVDIITRSEHLRRALFAERTLAKSAAGLGGLSLVLAVVGVYGVVAFFVSRRTREIGISMALGATPAQVMRQVLRFGAKLTGAGILIGGGLGVLLGWALAGNLYGVSATDPRMFLAAAIVTWPVALAATYLPARRAARIDPIVALRE
jgi:predicted permease